jgi:6-pyruvoyltetrahydropterin/6-carboxytetrahydropterin synthase
MTVRLTRLYRFAAAHRLHTPALTDEQNRATYGKCANPHGHGHNYEIELTVRGGVDPVTGRVIDLSELDEFAERELLSPFHHRNLNSEIAAFRTAVPTTENLARELDRRLRIAWPKSWPQMEKIRIRETDRNICEITDGQ